MEKSVIANCLSSFGLEDQAVLDYVESILEDELLDLQEKKDSILEFVEASMDSSQLSDDIVGVTIDRLVHDFGNNSKAIKPCKRVADESGEVMKIALGEPTVVTSTFEEDAKALEDAFWNNEDLKDDFEAAKLVGLSMQCSNEICIICQRIIEQYAVEFDDTVEFGEDGLLGSGLKQAGISKKLATNDANLNDDLWRNENRSSVAKAAQEKREIAKLQHEKELLRLKLQRQMELQKKEKEKQRVTKKERRTGR